MRTFRDLPENLRRTSERPWDLYRRLQIGSVWDCLPLPRPWVSSSYMDRCLISTWNGWIGKCSNNLASPWKMPTIRHAAKTRPKSLPRKLSRDYWMGRTHDFDRSRPPSLRSTDRVAHSLARPSGDYRWLGAPAASHSSRRADIGLCSSYDARRRCRAPDRVEGERPGHLSALADKRISSAVSGRTQAAFDPLSSDCGTGRILC